jgi:hypothetical protein
VAIYMRELLDILEEARRTALDDFAGTGIVEYNGKTEFDKITPVPMRMSDIDNTVFLVELPIHVIDKICRESNPFHDGFHFLCTQTKKFSHIGMYFPPPPHRGAHIQLTRSGGTRYFAALFASMIPGVVRTGIVRSSNLTLSIFQNGREIYYDDQ